MSIAEAKTITQKNFFCDRDEDEVYYRAFNCLGEIVFQSKKYKTHKECLDEFERWKLEDHAQCKSVTCGKCGRILMPGLDITYGYSNKITYYGYFN